MADMGLTTIATIASAAATAAGGAVAVGQGQAQADMTKKTAEFNARQMEKKAADERAAASDRAAAQREKANLALSRARTVAAASGGGATSEGVLDLTGDIAQRGDAYARRETWRGSETANSWLDQAAATRWTGESNARMQKATGVAKGIEAGFKVAGSVAGAPMWGGGDDGEVVYDGVGDKGWRTVARRSRGVYY